MLEYSKSPCGPWGKKNVMLLGLLYCYVFESNKVLFDVVTILLLFQETCYEGALGVPNTQIARKHRELRLWLLCGFLNFQSVKFANLPVRCLKQTMIAEINKMISLIVKVYFPPLTIVFYVMCERLFAPTSKSAGIK